MATSISARNYSSTTLPTQITTNIDNQTTTNNIPVVSTAGYPPAPFTGCFERNTINQEFCLVTGIPDAYHFTVVRGYDGTPPVQHLAPATFEHCVGAIDYREANWHHTDNTRDDHLQYLLTNGSRPSTGPQAFPAGISTNILSVAGNTPGSYVATRYVGGTAGPGPPGAGTYQVGDWALDTINSRWLCVLAGTPGTWIPETGHVYARVYGPAASTDIVNTTINVLTYTFTAVKGVQYVVDARFQASIVTALPNYVNSALYCSGGLLTPTVYICSFNSAALAVGGAFNGSATAALNIPAATATVTLTLQATSSGAGAAARCGGYNGELILRRG
jgi:hypothetical protein